MGGIVTQHEGEYELPSPPTLDHSGTCTQSWSVVFITLLGADCMLRKNIITQEHQVEPVFKHIKK